MLWFFSLKSISQLLYWPPITLGLQPPRPTTSEVGGSLGLGFSSCWLNHRNGLLVITLPGDSTIGNTTTLQKAQLILLWIFWTTGNDILIIDVWLWTPVILVCYLQTLEKNPSLTWLESGTILLWAVPRVRANHYTTWVVLNRDRHLVLVSDILFKGKNHNVLLTRTRCLSLLSRTQVV